VPVFLSGPWKALPIAGMAPRTVGFVQRRRGMLPAPARALLSVLREVLPAEAARQRGVTLSSPPSPLG
jgi:hypothetical protein